ncbi:MAG: hypothetical protein JWP84_2927 [Tardiphaga sp.]|nr:hypothetical protein [Tardiphaga sp.]
MTNDKASMLLAGGRLLDIDHDLHHPPHRDLLLENGRIVEVGDAATAIANRIGAIKLDVSGKLVLPGLINAHYHSHDTMLRGMFEQLPLDAWMLYSAPGQFAKLSADSVALRTALGASENLLNGVTTVQDMLSIVGDDSRQLIGALNAYKSSGIRTVLAIQASDRSACDCVAFWNHMPETTKRMIPQALDPSAIMRLIETAIAAPKQDRLHWGLGPSAPQRCSDEFLRWVARISQEADLQVFTHTYESRSQAVLARMGYADGSLIEHLNGFGLVNPRLTIAHGVWIANEEMRQLGAAKANVICNPTSNLKLLNGFAPIVAYAEAGVNVGLGCDNCSGNDAQNMFESMKMFALMWANYSKAGETGAAVAAFRAATIGSAKALGMSEEIGLLRPGYRADLTVIDLDRPTYRPINSAIRQLVYGETGRGVHTVIVDGKIVVQDGKLKNFSDEYLRNGAERLKTEIADDVMRLQRENAKLLPDILAAHEQSISFPLPMDRFLLRRQ